MGNMGGRLVSAETGLLLFVLSCYFYNVELLFIYIIYHNIQHIRGDGECYEKM